MGKPKLWASPTAMSAPHSPGVLSTERSAAMLLMIINALWAWHTSATPLKSSMMP